MLNNGIYGDTEFPFHIFDAHKCSLSFLYRFRLTAIVIMLTIVSWALYVSKVKFFIYMTLWGVGFTFIYFLFINICHQRYTNQISIPNADFALWKITHILCEIAFSLEVLIFIFYWSILAAFDLPDRPIWYIFFEICMHAVSPFLIVAENYINGILFHKRHIIVLLIIGLVYMVLNCLVTLIGGTPIYPPITWKSYWTAVFLGLALALGFGAFILGIYWSKKKRRFIEINGTLFNEEYSSFQGKTYNQ